MSKDKREDDAKKIVRKETEPPGHSDVPWPKPKKKPKQVRRPFADGSEHRPERAAASATARPCSLQWED